MKVNIELIDEKSGIDAKVQVDMDLSSHTMDDLIDEIKVKINDVLTEAREKADDKHIDKDFESMRCALTSAGVNIPIWVYPKV